MPWARFRAGEEGQLLQKVAFRGQGASESSTTSWCLDVCGLKDQRIARTFLGHERGAVQLHWPLHGSQEQPGTGPALLRSASTGELLCPPCSERCTELSQARTEVELKLQTQSKQCSLPRLRSSRLAPTEPRKAGDARGSTHSSQRDQS